MKFKKSDLIARIDNLLRHYEGEAIDRAEKHEEALIGSRDAWLEEHGKGFETFAMVIRRRIHSSQPVTIEDMPKEIKGYSNTSLAFYFPPAKATPDNNRRYENLQKLRAALCASEDESVSPTAIKQLGFQDVTFLFTPEAAK